MTKYLIKIAEALAHGVSTWRERRKEAAKKEAEEEQADMIRLRDALKERSEKAGKRAGLFR